MKATPLRHGAAERCRVDPHDVKFKRVDIPKGGAVKQYPGTEQANRAGKWFVSLRHLPNVKTGKWKQVRHLYRLSDNTPYETKASAEKEVALHMMVLEGYERSGTVFYVPTGMANAAAAQGVPRKNSTYMCFVEFSKTARFTPCSANSSTSCRHAMRSDVECAQRHTPSTAYDEKATATGARGPPFFAAPASTIAG